MHASRLSLHHFRVFPTKDVELSPGLNIFTGPNARGKTSILEALFICSVGQSFRTHQLSEAIRAPSSCFLIELEYQKCGISQEIKLRVAAGEKHVLINGAKQSLSDLYGGLLAVAATPDDIQLIKGTPSLRRDYLDQQLLQIDPLYSHHLRRYTRAIKQRNALLKARSVSTLDSWEYELAHSADYLLARRSRAIESLAKKYADNYIHLSGSIGEYVLKYKPGIPSGMILQSDPEQNKAMLRAMWRGQRERDLHLGATASGPHKDEMQMLHHEMDIRYTGSEGEQRTAALALRLAEWDAIKDHADMEKPLLLVDDIGYGLDSVRRRRLLDRLQHFGQVLLTTTEELSAESNEQCKIFNF